MGFARSFRRRMKRRREMSAKKRPRKALIEPLEPRLLLSADLKTTGVAAALSDGLSGFGDTLADFVETDELFDSRLPLILLQSENDAGDPVTVAPEFRDLFSISVDQDGDSQAETNGENELAGWDTDLKGLVSFEEMLNALLIDPITNQLSNPPSLENFEAFLEGLDHDTDGYVTVTDVSAQNLSSDSQVRFGLEVTLSIGHSLPLDLGLEADDLGLTLADGTVDGTASMALAFDFGVLTGGEEAEDEDFFVEISDLSFATFTPPEGEPLDTGMNIGCLGTDVSGTVTIQADIDATAQDPTTAVPLGFANDVSGDVLQGDPLSDYVLTEDVRFHLRVGNGDSREVRLDASATTGNTTFVELRDQLRSALDAAGFGTEVTLEVGDDGSSIKLSGTKTLTLTSRMSLQDLQGPTSDLLSADEGTGDTFSAPLAVDVKDGLLDGNGDPFDPGTVTISTGGDPFTLEDPQEDADGNLRFDLSLQSVGDFGALLAFNTITPASVISMLRGFESWLGSLRASDLYSSFGVPMTEATFADIFAFGDLFHNTFLYDESGGEARLLDENGAPTFSTAQELAARLNEALPDDVNARYNSETGELFFDIDITGDFEPQEVGTDFDLDLRPLTDVDSNSVFMLTGSTTLTLTMGIDLSPVDPESLLSTDTPLTELNYGAGASIKTEQAVTVENAVRTLYGRLSDGTEFKIVLNGGEQIEDNGEVLYDGSEITVMLDTVQFDGSDNSVINTNADTIRLGAHSFEVGDVVKYSSGGEPEDAVGGLTDGADYYIIVVDPDTVQLAAEPQGTAVSLTGLGVGTAHSLTGNVTSANEGIEDLVIDLNAALYRAGLADLLEATANGDRIKLVAIHDKVELVNLTADSANPAVRELGFRAEMRSEQALVVEAPNALTLDRGRLTDDASFDVQVNGDDQGTVTISSADTSTNLNAKALIADINATLQGSEISAITAELENGKIRFVADDTVTSFSITDQGKFDQLGFDGSGLFASEAAGTPAITTATDLPKIVGRLTGDASFEVQLDGEDAVTVTISADDTSANRNILDVVDDINRALSQVALRGEALTTYVLSEDASFSIVLDDGSGVPVTLDADATDGTATVGFDGSDETAVINTDDDTIRLGPHSFQPGEAVTYSSGGAPEDAVGGLTDGTDYCIIFVDFDTVKLAASAEDALAGTAVDLTGTGAGTAHSLTGTGTSENTNIEELVFDVNAALHEAGLGDLLEAISDGDRIKLVAIDEGVERLSLTDASDPAVTELGLPAGTATVRHFRASDGDGEELIFRAGNLGDRLVFTADSSIPGFMITQPDADNPAVTQLGLGTSQVSDTVDLLITLSNGDVISVDLSDANKVGDVLEAINLAGNGDILAALNNVGRLSADANFTLTVDGEGPVEVIVPWAKTTDNLTAEDLAEDINSALAKAGLEDRIEAKASDDGLRFILAATAGGGVTGYTLSTTETDPAVTELGLPSGVTLSTEGKIEAASNLQGTGLRLVDLSFDGDTPANNVEIFRVEATNGSPAAFQLGLLREDQKSADDEPDGIIDGGNLAGMRSADRFFVEQGGTVVSNFEVSSPPRSIPGVDVKEDEKGFYLESGKFTAEDFGRLITLSSQDGYFRIVDFELLDNPQTPEVEPNKAYVEGLNGQSLNIGDTVTVDFPGIQAAGRCGFAGVEMLGEGTLSGSLTATIRDPGQDPEASLPFYQDDGRASLAELDRGLADPDVTAVAEPVSSPSNGDYGALVFEVVMDPGLDTLIEGAALGIDPQITVTVDSLDPFQIEVTESDLGDLQLLADLEYGHILNSLQEVSQFLRAFEISGALEDSLPLINRSVSDLLGFADRFDDAVQSTGDNPAATLQALEGKLREALGIPATDTDSLVLSLFVDTQNAVYLRIDLQLQNLLSESLQVDLELDADRLVAPKVLKGFGDIAIDLAFGVKLQDPDPYDAYLFEGTGLAGSLSAVGDNINSWAVLRPTDNGSDPLSVYIAGGTAGLNAAYMAIPDADLFSDGLRPILETITDGRVELDETSYLTSDVTAELPLYYPTISGPPLDVIVVPTPVTSAGADGGNASVADAIRLTQAENGNGEESTPYNHILTAVENIDVFLEGIQDLLDGEVLGITIPFIGDQLGEAARFIEDLRGDFIAPLRDGVESFSDPNTNLISQLLFDLLGDTGIGLLLNADGTAEATGPEDIGFTLQVDEDDQFVQWDLKIGHELQEIVGIDIDIDLGIPGLGIDIDGPLTLLLGWDLDLKLGVSTKDGPYLDISDPDDLKLELAVELPDRISGKLGFLQLDAESMLGEGEYPLRAAFAVDLVSQLALKAETTADPFAFTADSTNPAVTELWFETEQESFFGSVVSSNEVPENGRLSGELRFNLTTDVTTTYEVIVSTEAYSDNFTREDLVDDVAFALKSAKIIGSEPVVYEDISDKFQVGLDGNLLALKRSPKVKGFLLEAETNDLGIPTVQASAGNKNFITFGSSLPADGKLENKLTFYILPNPEGGQTAKQNGYKIEISDSDTEDNNSRDDLLQDIRDAIDAVLPLDLNGQFELASGDPRMSFWELGDMGIDFGLAAEAVADLGLTLRINSDLVDERGVFPEVSADFLLEWGIGEIDASGNDYVGFSDLGNAIKDGLELVQFTDVSLDLGSFISDFVGPVLDQIKEITEPIQDVVDFLTAPIPVISDLGPPVTMLDIAAIFGNVDSGFITAIANVITLINSIPTDADSLLINFGDFVIYQKADGNGNDGINDQLDLSDPKTLQNLNELDNWSKDFDFDEAMKGKPASKTTQFTKTVNKSEGFSFPILEDPSEVFGMLLGEPATLMTYDLPDLTLEFTYEQYFPIFGPLGASITGSIGATIDFHEVGFDTSGIIRFADSGFRNPALIFDGFFISDLDQAGNDVPEVTLFGGLSAAAEINLVVVSAGVAGGVYAEIEFDLYDPDEDGKVRVSEIVGSIVNEYRFGEPALSPLAMFDVSGEVFARLFAFFEIDLFFFSIREEFNILPPITILDFEIPFTRPPYLATELPGGVLQVNAGEFAGERKNVNDQDGAEIFAVTATEEWTTVAALGFSQNYTGSFNTIVMATGEGDDVLNIDLAAGVHLELDLGAGNDQVTITGGGTATIYGGPGDDVINAGDGADVIYGGAGNDTITGGRGEDIIFGGIGVLKEDESGTKLRVSVSVRDDEGADTIDGGGGDDIIFGGGGGDTISGGADDDLIIADAGSFDFDEQGKVPTTSPEVDITQINTRSLLSVTNRLFGGEGGDTLFGGRGDDFIDGGAGNDQILGLAGFDVLYGGSGADSIWGGTGADVIFGYNSDQEEFEGKELFAGKYLDEMYGGVVDNFDGDKTDRDEEAETPDSGDYIYGEDGNDIIFGGNEPDDDIIDDYIDGGRGVNLMFGERGDDILLGGLASTVTYGGDGSDTFIVYMRGGATSSLITVSDLGTSPADTDELIVYGTDFDDLFLLRASANPEGLAFVAMLNGDDEVERINYDGLERLTVNGMAGNDRFAVDDVRAEATLNGGVGEDFFQIGQLYRSPRAGNDEANIDSEDEFATIEVTRGFLSNGISLPMTVNGGADDDEFVVFHNKAVLTLNGGTGDDRFSIRAFALAGSQDNLRERTDISGDSGADLIQYAVNAPVNIDGGDGLDTVIVIGTEFADDFVVTEDGVYGAGLNVNFVGIEVLRVDGAEGDDRFFVLSTGENFITEIAGGLGSDTFNMSGETPPVISNDLLGHSGIITHSIENTGSNYDETMIAGISANVADNDEPAIRITETGGTTVVGENNLVDTYTVVLTRQPTLDVYVKVMAPVQTPEEEQYGWKGLTVRSDHQGAKNEPDGSATTLHFTPTDWFIAQEVTVEAPIDLEAEGVRYGAINHMVISEEKLIGEPEPLEVLYVTEDFIFDEDDGLRYLSANSFTLGGKQTGQVALGAEVSFDSAETRVEERIYRAYTFTAADDGLTVTDHSFTVDGDQTGQIVAGAKVFFDTDTGPGETSLTDRSYDGVSDTTTVTVSDVLPDTLSELTVSFTTVTVSDPVISSGLTELTVSNSSRLTAAAGTFDPSLNLLGAKVRIVEGAGRGQLRLIESWTEDTLTFYNPWDEDDLPGAGSKFVVVRDDALRGPVTASVIDTFQDSRARFPIQVGGLTGATVTITSGGQEESHEIVHNTVNTITVDSPWTIDVGADSTYAVTMDGVPVEVNDVPVEGTVTSIVTKTFTVTGTGFPVTDLDNELNGLRASIIEITGGTGLGQMRIVEFSGADRITVTTPWRTELDETSQYVIYRYDGLALPSVTVRVNDVDQAGVVITRTENATVVIEGAEGDTFGASDTYTVALTRMTEFPDGTPEDDKLVTVTLNVGDQLTVTSDDQRFSQNDLGQPVLTFDATNWGDPVVLTVSALDDDIREGFHHGYITHSVTSADIDTAEVTTDSFTLAEKAQTSVLLRNYPLSDQPVSVMLDDVELDSGRFELSSSTIIFLDEDGQPEKVSGNVEVTYSYLIPGYDGVEVERVVVNIGDKDTPGVMITESNGSTNLIESVPGSLLSTDKTEIPYDQSLTQYNNVYYNKTLTFDFDVSGLTPLEGGVLTVSAIADLDLVGEYLELNAEGVSLGNLFATGGKQYSPVTTTVELTEEQLGNLATDGTIQFTVKPSSAVDDFSWLWWYYGSSNLALQLTFPAAVDTVAEFPVEDTYTVVLTKQPEAPVTINVTPQPTRTTRGTLVTFTKQVKVSSTTLIFTPENWDVPQAVTVSAIDDRIVDGGDTKVFAPTLHTVNDIKGPLFIDGVGGEGSLAGLTPPVMLPGETNLKASTGEVVGATELTLTVKTADVEPYGSLLYRTVEITRGLEAGVGQFRLILNTAKDEIDGVPVTILTLNDPWDLEPGDLAQIKEYAITDESLNFFVDETEQVDFLTVFHEDSVADNTGALQDLETQGYDKNISGLGMGPGLTLRGMDYPGGITYGNLEVVEINLGSGNDEFFVDDIHSREDGFRTWTMLNTGPGDDDVTVALDTENEGLFALNTGEGDDSVDASTSTLSLVIIGWDGNDSITGGQGNDIIFGDHGRVDYLKERKILTDQAATDVTETTLADTSAEFPEASGLKDYFVRITDSSGSVQVRMISSNTTNELTVSDPWAIDGDETYTYEIFEESPEIVTRLGATPEPITGSVISAGENSLVVDLDEDLDLDQLPTEDEGLRGLVVWINDGTGTGQSRLILSNKENTLTLDTPWSVLPDETSKYRITGRPSDQTDGEPLEPRLLFTVDNDTGGEDIIRGGGGEDLLIGGAVDDVIDGSEDADLIFGDNVKLDRRGDYFVDFTNPRFRTHQDTLIYDADGSDLVDHSEDYENPVGTPTWANWEILMSEQERFNDAGDDYIAGGAHDDTIFGQLGNDRIQGDGSIATAVGLEIAPAESGTLHILETAGDSIPFDGSSVEVVDGSKDTIRLPAHELEDGQAVVYYNGDGSDVDGLVDGASYIVRVVDEDTFRLAQPVSAARDGEGMLQIVPSSENASDGDDYIEGNGGDDVIFGNLGQDDIIGGNSNLFSLIDPLDPVNDLDLRQDGNDTIFGGAGKRIDRNHALTEDNRDTIVSDEEHARDADMILGDNGNIFRLVGTNETNSGNFLTFSYDNYNESLKIIPRAAQLLDYTPGGAEYDPAAASDIGSADEIHGESGDDFIYGMAGDDVLFGDAQDDDLIGGYGHDWISGGSGEDGILGDDGRIFTSRNGDIEPLNGRYDASVQTAISIPGPFTGAVVFISGRLTKTVDLEPFEVGGSDILYGGLGDDFIHGGAGDDAISGAEALTEFYGAPQPDSDPLAYDPDTGMFDAYDADNPREKISGFLLNFEAFDAVGNVIEDGKDRLFGDLGHDWIVGGTGHDRLFGGFGDDLLNLDDNLDTNGGLNDEADDRSWGDFAYGGGGLDVLIANTGLDRMFDWTGEFNSFIVPFSRFGAPVVNRLPSPNVKQFLFDLGAAAGADQTLTEPNGELGLVTQKDPEWGEQHGSPRDPQPGNGTGRFDDAGGPEDDTDKTPTLHGSTPASSTDLSAGAGSGGGIANSSPKGKGKNLMAAEAPQAEVSVGSSLTYDDLAPIIDEATDRWSDALSLEPVDLTLLSSLTFRIVNLDGLTLGETTGTTVLIDADAAGYGWFVDPTPSDDTEFRGKNAIGTVLATTSSPAYGDMDLLTVVMHELGHVLGFDDIDPETNDAEIMNATLDEGVRYLPKGTFTDQAPNDADRLISMDLTPDEDAADGFLDSLVDANPWLAQYLVDGAREDMNPNGDIAVVIDDEETSDPDSGKGKKS